MNKTALAARAKTLLKNNCLALDTETTGLGKADEVIEVAVVNTAGVVIFESFVKPRYAEVGLQAFQVYRIGPKQLAEASPFPALWRAFSETIKGRNIVAYNAAFDLRMLSQTCAAWADELPHGQFAMDSLALNWSCLMNGYTDYNKGKRVSLTEACNRHNIEPGNHSAASDARAALALLQTMAGARVRLASAA